MLISSRRRRGERGQVLPMWIFGTIAALTIMFSVVNYAQIVRYQIRAQNDADAAAQGEVDAQTYQWNQMEAVLYAANVEEYRIRGLLDGMLLAINRSGGCNAASYSSTVAGACNRVYQDLKAQYGIATVRYTNDILMLDSITGQMQQSVVIAAAQNELAGNNYFCNNPTTTTQYSWTNGGDCSARITVDSYAFRTGLSAVDHDAVTTLVPGLGRGDTVFGHDTENANFFAPLEVDVVACITVPPVFGNVGALHWPTYQVIGRAAATAAQTEQDYLQPGAVCDPAHTAYSCGNAFANFQPPEEYTPTVLATSYLGNSSNIGSYNYYSINYGGNAMTANAAVPAYQGSLVTSEFSAMMGWWGSVPIKPFGPALVQSNVC